MGLRPKLEVMVVVPMLTRSGLHPRTAQSLWALDLPNKANRIVNFPVDRPTTSARSDAIRMAKEFRAETLLFIDSDMEFEPDAYRKLLKTKGDIVCGLFWNRVSPSYPTICVKKRNDDGTDRLETIQPDGTVQDVDAVGMAFTLIRKPVIEWAEYPAFQHLGAISEDYVFCLKARKDGFSIRCDTSLQIGHRGDVGFNGQKQLIEPGSESLSFPFGVTRERESWKRV